jgi:hypothetical protein
MNEKEWRELLKQFKCVGCGWCCMVIGVCWPGSHYYYKQQGIEKGIEVQTRLIRIKPPCPYIKWSEEDQRFWCSIFDEFNETELREGLHYRLGCNDPTNPWRKRMFEESEIPLN